MYRVLLLALAILASSSWASAQDYKRGELFAGYSHNRVDTGTIDIEREGFHGFNTSLTANVSRHVGFKFDFAGHFKERDFTFPTGTLVPDVVNIKSRAYTFLGGVQVKDNSTEETFKPFAHALVGGAHVRNKVTSSIVCFDIQCGNFTANDTGFAAAVGGGIDIRAGSRIDIRVIQFDYNPTLVFDTTQHNFRIGVGVVVH